MIMHLKASLDMKTKVNIPQMSVIRVKCYHDEQDFFSPERSSDGVSQAEVPQAAEVQREAVVVGGGGDGHFGSRDTD